MIGNDRASGRRRDSRQSLAEFDARYFERGEVRSLAGIDEAGRGALAGPVVAAAVVVERGALFEGLNDSKKLTPIQRATLYPAIRMGARAVGVGWASAQEVDERNVLEATLLAAKRALEALEIEPDLILTDFLRLEGVTAPVEPLVKGDGRSQAIAAASVVAKVARDRWMQVLDAEYPLYGFASHKGYGTPGHLEALSRFGSSTVHRHSFRGVDWFENDYRTSVTLGGLLEALEGGDRDLSKGAECEAVWRREGRGLPECELQILRKAAEKRRRGRRE